MEVLDDLLQVILEGSYTTEGATIHYSVLSSYSFGKETISGKTIFVVLEGGETSTDPWSRELIGHITDHTLSYLHTIDPRVAVLVSCNPKKPVLSVSIH